MVCPSSPARYWMQPRLALRPIISSNRSMAFPRNLWTPFKLPICPHFSLLSALFLWQEVTSCRCFKWPSDSYILILCSLSRHFLPSTRLLLYLLGKSGPWWVGEKQSVRWLSPASLLGSLWPALEASCFLVAECCLVPLSWRRPCCAKWLHQRASWHREAMLSIFICSHAVWQQ